MQTVTTKPNGSDSDMFEVEIPLALHYVNNLYAFS